MSNIAEEDPDEGWQKQKKAVRQRSFSKLRAFISNALVNRQSLLFIFNSAFAVYKLVKFIIQLF